MPKVATNDPRWKAAGLGDSVKEDLRKALAALDYMPNAVAAWEDAHGGNKALARANEEKIHKAQQLLGEVLASLPAAIEYLVVGLGMPLKWQSREQLVHELKEFGIKETGETPRGTTHRPEIQGQPTFDKLIGPMYGGPGVARYETSETYDRQSR